MLFEMADEPASDIDEGSAPRPFPSVKKATESPFRSKNISGERGANFNAAIEVLSCAKTKLWSEAAARTQLTSITDYFK